MKDVPVDPQLLDSRDKASLVMDMLTRIMVHHGIWFSEVRHQMGMEKALDALDTATKKSLSIAMAHLAKAFVFDVENEMPAALANASEDTLEKAMAAAAKAWLANDGVWFQAVEFAHGMNDAKRCNDSCWAKFSPYEAHAVKQMLNLGTAPGLEGLKQALNYRMYAFINRQEIVDEGPDAFVFKMCECRVQQARQRKHLDDYPCKSAGLVEYTYFAQAIDLRIKTECIGCPPDPHPDDWFCAWRFTMAAG